MFIHFLWWFVCWWGLICLFLLALMTADFLTWRFNRLFLGRHQGLFRKPIEGGIYSGFLSWAMMPLSISALLLMAVIFTPYFWLYPERHASILDFEGTDAEKRAWSEYKAVLSRKPFWRRLAERLKLVPDLGPPWPMLNQDAA